MKVTQAAAIRRLRQRHGLSQRELAFLCRPCSQTTIYLLETGRMSTLSDVLAERIARRLGVETYELFESRDSPTTTAALPR